MKRNILLLFAFLLSLYAISQNTIGLKAGISLAHQTTFSDPAIFPHPTLQTKPLFGYQFGIFYKAKINKKLTFSAEANFFLAGGREQYMFLPLNGDTALKYQYYNNKIGYTEVPLMIQYNLNRFYISAGPSLLFKLFSKSALSGSTLYYKSFDVAANLLGGYRVSKKWDVNLRYSYGLYNINEDSYGDVKRKNRNLNISLLYTLK